MRELILCFSAADVHAIAPPSEELIHGVRLDEVRPWFVERDHAEQDESFRQVIPYAVIVHDGAVLACRRAKKGGDARLRSKLTIGFGGHVEIEDAVLSYRALDVQGTMVQGFRRELREELYGCRVTSCSEVGTIISNAEPVSRVHIGRVFRCSVRSRDDVEPQEDAITELRWLPIAELGSIVDELEGWAAMCARWLMREQTSGRAHEVSDG